MLDKREKGRGEHAQNCYCLSNVILERITVQKGRGCVEVLNWGNSPFAFERTNTGEIARIPSNFRSQTLSDNEIWIGETYVNKDLRASYRFTLARNYLIQSS